MSDQELKLNAGTLKKDNKNRLGPNHNARVHWLTYWCGCCLQLCCIYTLFRV